MCVRVLDVVLQINRDAVTDRLTANAAKRRGFHPTANGPRVATRPKPSTSDCVPGFEYNGSTTPLILIWPVHDHKYARFLTSDRYINKFAIVWYNGIMTTSERRTRRPARKRLTCRPPERRAFSRLCTRNRGYPRGRGGMEYSSATSHLQHASGAREVRGERRGGERYVPYNGLDIYQYQTPLNAQRPLQRRHPRFHSLTLSHNLDPPLNHRRASRHNSRLLLLQSSPDSSLALNGYPSTGKH